MDTPCGSQSSSSLSKLLGCAACLAICSKTSLRNRKVVHTGLVGASFANAGLEWAAVGPIISWIRKTLCADYVVCVSLPFGNQWFWHCPICVGHTSTYCPATLQHLVCLHFNTCPPTIQYMRCPRISLRIRSPMHHNTFTHAWKYLRPHFDMFLAPEGKVSQAGKISKA